MVVQRPAADGWEGTTAPDAVSTAVIRKNTHGIAATRPPNSLKASR